MNEVNAVKFVDEATRRAEDFVMQVFDKSGTKLDEHEMRALKTGILAGVASTLEMVGEQTP